MFETRTPKVVVMAKYIKTILWIHFITALVCVLIDLSHCAVTGVIERATSCYPECLAGEYCNEMSDVCEKCSCCCQDQIDHNRFEDKCVDTSPPYNWCTAGSCPMSDCVPAPTPTTAEISSATQVQNFTSITPTGTSVMTTVTPTNGTNPPYSTISPQPRHGGLTKNLDAIVIGAVVGALLALIIVLVLTAVYLIRKRKMCQKSSCGSAYLDQNSVVGHEVRVDEPTSPSEDQCQNDGRVCEVIPATSQSPPELSSHGNSDGCIDDEDDDAYGAFDNADDERESLIREDKNKMKSTKRKEHQPETSCKVAVPITQNMQSTRDMSQTATYGQKDCTFTVKEMMENMELIEDLSKLLDVPVCCTQGARRLGEKFANLDYKNLNFLDYHSSAEKPLTKYVFDKILRTNSRLKCVEIVKFLQEELRMNDVVMEIQKHHPDCDGCRVYYDRI